MSNSATFKYRGPDKRCPFPFDRDSADAFGLVDYVALTELGGDDGLAEACRIFWLLDSVTFSPTGTITIEGESPDFYASFDGDITFSYSDEVGVPYERAGYNYSSMSLPFKFGSGAGTYGGYSTASAFFVIAYVSGEWRLYYSFSVNLYSGEPEFDYFLGEIKNPYGGTPSGDFMLFGYSLNYILETPFTPSGIDLSASAEFYTLV